jgi:hypothetical protein
MSANTGSLRSSGSDITKLGRTAVRRAGKFTRFSIDESRKYLKGVIAHAVIQTAYRLEHLANVVVSERSIWVGDTSVSTISRFADKIDAALGENITLSRLKELGAKNLAPDVLTFLLYVINESTKDYIPAGRQKPASAGTWIFKRYDIIDFGLLSVMSPAIAAKRIAGGRLFGEASEIKADSNEEKSKGAAYIAGQVPKFNTAMSTFGPLVANALGLPGLNKYEMRPGKSWPVGTRQLQLGLGTLSFKLADSYSGVISYEWNKFDPRGLAAMWAFYRAVSMLTERALSLRTAPLLIGGVAGAVAVAMVSMVLAGLIEVAAAAELAEAVDIAVAAARNLAPRAGAVLQGISEGAMTAASGAALAAAAFQGSPAAAQPSTNGSDLLRQTAPGAPEQGNLGQKVSAFQHLTSPNSTDQQLFRSPEGSSEGLPGGTPPTSDEKFVDDVVNQLISEVLWVFSSRVGQGDEDLLNEESQAIVGDNIRVSIGDLVGAIGPDGLRNLFGVKSDDDQAAAKIATNLAGTVAAMLDANGGPEFFMLLFTTPDDELVEMLPTEYNDDGEVE